MEVKKSLIAVGVTSVLMVGAWATASANTDKDDDSVYQWGRWAVLAPAAGVQEVVAFAPVGTANLGSCASDENCPTFTVTTEQPEEPPVEPPVATSPCEAGAPCGFARVDHPYRNQIEAPDSSSIAPFQLVMTQGGQGGDTVAFVVDPGTADEIASGTVSAIIRPTVVVAYPGGPILSGLLTPGDDEAPAVGRGVWGVDESGGEFVWGITANASQMASFISGLGGDRIANYSGFTQGVLNGGEGAVNMSVNFSDATWSGQFNNNAFTASGVVVDSGFVSNAAGFSPNIASGEVYGAFVNAGNNAIGAYDVTNTVGVRSADVFKADFVNNIPQ
ncbi:MAG: hypothetical protein KKE76_08910 [Gammaproteobacteria bacterium]|nr:hypothetical protein [Gammaproteobacteria bacterium]